MRIVLVAALSCFSASALLAQAVAPGLVFKTDRVVPVVAAEIWTDEEITLPFLWNARPSVDALVGYDPSPASEKMLVGYQAVLNWQITERTAVFAGMAYLNAVHEVELKRLGEDLGVAVGAKLRF